MSSFEAIEIYLTRMIYPHYAISLLRRYVPFVTNPSQDPPSLPDDIDDERPDENLDYDLIYEMLLTRLPPELVFLIFDLADIRNLTIFECENSCLASSNGPLHRVTWFQTAPLSSAEVNNIHSIQLVTHGRDQGFSNPTHGHWAWFELEVDGERSMSHSAPRDSGESKGHVFKINSSPCSTVDHEVNEGLFSQLQEGSSIIVNCVAQFPAWKCYGLKGELRVRSYWQTQET